MSYIFCTFMIVAGFYFYSNQKDIFNVLFLISNKFGTIALFLFLGSLLPGIFQRFKNFPLFSASMILFRRQVGILMYFMALMHSMYISTIPAIINNSFSLENLPSNGLTGVLTLSILFPVWITSNDLSQKYMGKWWKIIQRLTYFAMISLFLHVALVEKSAALLTFSVFGLEITSWINVWFFNKKKSESNSAILKS